MTLDSLQVSWAERQLWCMLVSVDERMGLAGTRTLMVCEPGAAQRPEPSTEGTTGSLCFAGEWWDLRLLPRIDKSEPD